MARRSNGTTTASSDDVVIIDSDNDDGNCDSKRTFKGVDVKIEWSSEEDPDAAYLAFKNRKTLKRKRAAAESRRVRAAHGPNFGRKKNAPPVVGRRITSKNRHGEDVKPKKEEIDEDELLDEKLRPYLVERKEKFRKVRDTLGEAGLKLPPIFEDISFSEDERIGKPSERPVLPELRPIAPYEDVVLEYSGGIIPAPIAQRLREYQVQGAAFLHEKFVYQQGGILGDDMGLGKTIQVIAFLTAAFGKTGDERDGKRMRKIRRKGKNRWYPRILIVCPGSLMPNWRQELNLWGWWSIYAYHGTTADKEAALQAAASGMAEIVITTYTTYRMNMDAINTVDWDCVIADECHALKTRGAEITEAMNQINALCRIGLTGTAIQNNYDELWCILNWANPGIVGSLSSWKYGISNPLKTGQAHDASVTQLATARRTAQSLVQNLLPRFFLRRMKSLIADQLPKKSDRVVFCPLTDKQAEAYENYINGEIVKAIRHSVEACECGSGKKAGWCCDTEIEDRGAWQKYVFPAIVTLQKLANHLALLLSAAGDTQDKQLKDIDNLQIALPDEWRKLYNAKDSIINFANEDFCGKWKVLKRLLAFWYNNGDKVLIFSHSVRLLQMLYMLFAKTTTYNLSYLDGKMSYNERQMTVDDFNSNPLQFVFLISSKAGGVGLNITSANKVVVVDPNWNPAHDLQAQDRAYRIGQQRDVEVFRLVSAGTIEEIVYARQIYKQQQANIGYNASSERRYFTGVQDRSGKKGEIFGLENLFAYQGDHVVLQEIVNKTNIAESKAGVFVADIDLSQAEEGRTDEDLFAVGDSAADSQEAHMSQLASLIENGGDKPKPKRNAPDNKKTDVIQGILASVGVEYTHENSEVIGTSKVESKLSHRALNRTTSTLEQAPNEPVFKNFLTSAAVIKRNVGEIDHESDVEMLEPVEFRYKPPADVRKRIFCSMSRFFGFDSAIDFALVVEGWTQDQRRICLDKFYEARRTKLVDGAFAAEPLGKIKVEDKVKIKLDPVGVGTALEKSVKQEYDVASAPAIKAESSLAQSSPWLKEEIPTAMKMKYGITADDDTSDDEL